MLGAIQCLHLYRLYIYIWYAVAQLVEALRYKPERRGFDSLADPSGRAV